MTDQIRSAKVGFVCADARGFGARHTFYGATLKLHQEVNFPVPARPILSFIFAYAVAKMRTCTADNRTTVSWYTDIFKLDLGMLRKNEFSCNLEMSISGLAKINSGLLLFIYDCIKNDHVLECAQTKIPLNLHHNPWLILNKMPRSRFE